MKQKLRCYLDVSHSCYYVKGLVIQCPLTGERVRTARLEIWSRPHMASTKGKDYVSFFESIVSDIYDNYTQVNYAHFKAPEPLLDH